jgi:hypothetical protein
MSNMLITLPDGSQLMVAIADGASVNTQAPISAPSVKYRDRMSGCWGLAFPVSERPHQERTIFIGEW